MLYEYHNFLDSDLKIIYHLDVLKKPGFFSMHLHRNVELLLMTEGEARVGIDSYTCTLREGEMLVIAPNSLHVINPITERCVYHCLIIDHSLYEKWFSEEERVFPTAISDAEVIKLFEKIVEFFDGSFGIPKVSSPLENQAVCIRQEIKANIMLMLAKIFRIGASSTPAEVGAVEKSRIFMTREAIVYMHQHFEEAITMEDICKSIGFSKYYFCRTFKEVTGRTPFWHLNYIRCQAARSLLKEGNVSITECAFKCGFNNASYFCKTYKRYFGTQPGKDTF